MLCLQITLEVYVIKRLYEKMKIYIMELFRFEKFQMPLKKFKKSFVWPIIESSVQHVLRFSKQET